MLLTAVAYSLVVADSLPTLGYLTWLDKYIFGTYLFLSLVVIEFASMEALAWESVNDANLVLFNVIVLAVFQLFFYITARESIQKSRVMRAGGEWNTKSNKIFPFADLPDSVHHLNQAARLPLSSLLRHSESFFPDVKTTSAKSPSAEASIVTVSNDKRVTAADPQPSSPISETKDDDNAESAIDSESDPSIKAVRPEK